MVPPNRAQNPSWEDLELRKWSKSKLDHLQSRESWTWTGRTWQGPHSTSFWQFKRLTTRDSSFVNSTWTFKFASLLAFLLNSRRISFQPTGLHHDTFDVFQFCLKYLASLSSWALLKISNESDSDGSQNKKPAAPAWIGVTFHKQVW